MKIALAGNPNCGKTTLFNALTGSSQYVGNWPGVTVEKKDGVLSGHKDVVIQDLPGIYSLSPYSIEEKVSRQFLVEDGPDAILNIVDGEDHVAVGRPHHPHHSPRNKTKRAEMPLHGILAIYADNPRPPSFSHSRKCHILDKPYFVRRG